MEHFITDDADEPYQPAPLATAVILATGFVITALALWKLADILGALYTYMGG